MKKVSSLLLGFLLLFTTLYPGFSHAAPQSIVNPKQVYTYGTMVNDIKRLAKAYPGLITYRVIGKSEYGRDIYAVSLGKGKAAVLINASHHAREWITTNLSMYMIDQYAQAYANKSSINGYPVPSILNQTTLWFVPMVDPDGVTLQQSGVKGFPKAAQASLLRMNGNKASFISWKANAKGIDLNRQYDANWKTITDNEKYPGPKNHKGSAPQTASEIKAMVAFTATADPEMTASYHSSGHILFWYYGQTGENYKRDYAYAKKLRQMTGYSLVAPTPNPSGGGYKDWFVMKYKRPGFTLEISPVVGEKNPPLSVFDNEWNRNKAVGLYLAQEGYKLYKARHKDETQVPADRSVSVEINGDKLAKQGIIRSNVVLIPAAEMADKLGYTIQRQESMKTIILRKEETATEVPAQLIGESLYVPLNAVKQIFGATAEWNSLTNTARILFLATPDKDKPNNGEVESSNPDSTPSSTQK